MKTPHEPTGSSPAERLAAPHQTNPETPGDAPAPVDGLSALGFSGENDEQNSDATPDEAAPADEGTVDSGDRSRQPGKKEGRLSRLARGLGAATVRNSASWDLSHKPKTLMPRKGPAIKATVRRQDPSEESWLPRTTPSWMHRVSRVDQIVAELVGRPGMPASPAHSSFRVGRHNLLVDLIRQAESKPQKFVDKSLDNLAPEGSKRAELLEDTLGEAQRWLYSRLTGVLVNGTGKLVPQQNETIAPWVNALDPHRIVNLKKLYVQRWMQQTEDKPLQHKEIIARKHLRTGSPVFLDPTLMSQYLGVSKEDWIAQIAGRKEIVPRTVLEALGHYMAISDENLESVCAAIPPFATSDSLEITQVGADKRTEISNHDIREAIHGTEAVSGKGDLIAELTYVDKFIKREIDAEVQKRSPGSMMPRDEYRELTAEVRERVIREYLGDEATDDDVDQFASNLARHRLARRK